MIGRYGTNSREAAAAGAMGTDRASTEVLHLFDQARVRTNRPVPDPLCFCNDPATLGRGDSKPLLDITWREEQ